MDTNNKIIKIIARGSRLSKIQVEEFKKKFPEIRFETEYVSSFGDKNQEISLLNGEAPDDMFTRELDRAIIDRRADIAVLQPRICRKISIHKSALWLCMRRLTRRIRS